MISKIRNNKAAFTLVEIMIVVAIIGLLAALAIPGFVKARKQSQGRRVINDARQLDAALDQWAIEKGKKLGDAINTTEASSYIKGGVWITEDAVHNPYTVNSIMVDTAQVLISTDTKSSLAGVGIDWGSF